MNYPPAQGGTNELSRIIEPSRSRCHNSWQSLDGHIPYTFTNPLDDNLHSPNRRLIELQIEHSDLNALIDRAALAAIPDELLMKRLKKRRLKLRDELVRLQNLTEPDDQA